MKLDPYWPEDLSPDLPLTAGLSRNDYKLVNHEYQRMISRYSRAVEELDLTFYKLKQKLDASLDHTVIQSIRSRIKSPESMCEKIVRLGMPCTLNSIQENLYDIAGMRIICSYIDDIYSVLGWMKRCRDFKILQVKDYIKNPKPSGYRSLHVIFSMTILDGHTVCPVYCEVQLRTATMHAWSALEHQLQYKKGSRLSQEVARDLQECAALMNATDRRMQEIYHKLRKDEEQEESETGTISDPELEDTLEELDLQPQPDQEAQRRQDDLGEIDYEEETDDSLNLFMPDDDTDLDECSPDGNDGDDIEYPSGLHKLLDDGSESEDENPDIESPIHTFEDLLQANRPLSHTRVHHPAVKTSHRYEGFHQRVKSSSVRNTYDEVLQPRHLSNQDHEAESQTIPSASELHFGTHHRKQ